MEFLVKCQTDAMPQKTAPKGLIDKVERAAEAMRDTATHLHKIADKIEDKDTAEELEHLREELLRQSHSLLFAATRGDLVGTNLAARVGKWGLAGIALFGSTIVKDAGDSAYDALIGAQAKASEGVQNVQNYTIEIGAQAVDGDLKALQEGLATFADTFTTVRGTQPFPSFPATGALNTEQRISDIQTMLYQMRDWLSKQNPRQIQTGFYAVGSAERVGAELESTTVQLERILGMRQLLNEEVSPQRRRSVPSSPTDASTPGSAHSRSVYGTSLGDG